jgi:4-amino-4-deoxy-L-arabinose transferase-like glycosyltransferase
MTLSRTFLSILIAAIILLFLRLGATTVFQVAEGRNAQCAAEMMEGNRIVPVFNNKLRTDKPPVHYYMMMAAYAVAGKTEGASRFFSAVAGLLLVMGTWWVARRNISENAATLSACVLLASLHFIFQFRLATPDPYLILAHVFALYAFWEGYARNNGNGYLMMYAMMGLAFFAKGPVGLALPAATIFFFLLFRRELTLRTIGSLRILPGIFIFAAIALPWYYLVHVQTNGDWTRGFFLEHNVGRFGSAVDGHRGPFILPLVFVLAGLFPFSVFIPLSVLEAWKKRTESPFLLFMLLGALFIIVPYAFSRTKLINYTSPAYPFLAILVGAYLTSLRKTGSHRWEFWVLGIISLLFPVGFAVWVKSDKIPELLPYTWAVGLITLGAFGAWYLYARRNDRRWWQMLAACSMLFNMLFFAVLFPVLDRSGSVSILAPVVRDAKRMVGFGRINDAFVFYHRKPIPVMSAAGVRSELNEFPDALVLQLGKKADLTDSIPGLVLIHDEKDLFSSQHSFIYQKKKDP